MLSAQNGEMSQIDRPSSAPKFSAVSKVTVKSSLPTDPVPASARDPLSDDAQGQRIPYLISYYSIARETNLESSL